MRPTHLPGAEAGHDARLAEALAPLRAEPARSAVLLDIDGVLAPIVRHAEDAIVSEQTRALLIAVAKRYGVVACVSGRRSVDARRLVALGSIAYVGNQGAELLPPGGRELEEAPGYGHWRRRVQSFARQTDAFALQRLRVRTEDKGVIVAYHWRGAPDEEAARQAVLGVAEHAEAAGLATHWGRKVLEVRPPGAVNKGDGVAALLRGADVDSALYAGDDATDLDAFRCLSDLTESGRLSSGIRVAVRSDESPEELLQEADVVVEGTKGVHGLLRALLAD